jgi:acyl carrier protein
MSEPSISLRNIMANVFECSPDDVSADAAVNQTVGWDSLSHISLMLELGKYGVRIAPLQIPDLTTYTLIRDYLREAGSTIHD